MLIAVAGQALAALLRRCKEVPREDGMSLLVSATCCIMSLLYAYKPNEVDVYRPCRNTGVTMCCGTNEIEVYINTFRIMRCCGQPRSESCQVIQMT